MTTDARLGPEVAKAASSRRLIGSEAREAGWTFWELRTLGLHRVVGLSERQVPILEPGPLESDLRVTVSRHFRRAWWRGMAYGVVVDAPAVQVQLQQIENLVDVRDNGKGTLQWVVLVSRSTREVFACHTWIEGYLSPVYRDIVRGLEAAGFSTATTTKAKGGLMSFLTAAGGTHFEDFHEPR